MFFYVLTFAPSEFIYSIKLLLFNVDNIVILCSLPIFWYLILLFLDRKRFLKIRYLLINLIPLFFTLGILVELKNEFFY